MIMRNTLYNFINEHSPKDSLTVFLNYNDTISKAQAKNIRKCNKVVGTESLVINLISYFNN